MFKKDFNYFKNTQITYLDNAATTQKPKEVINATIDYYENYCANTHRSNFGHANRATKEFEEARITLKNFINAKDTNEIIFTKGASESINFIASSYGKDIETIIISSLEHHSNIVPWHIQGRSVGKGLEIVKYKENLEFDFEHFEELLKKHKNALVSITHISNAFGVIHNIKAICELSRKYNAKVLIDGAQSLAHKKIDVQDLGVDFFVISAHKTFGPTGVGAVYIKKDLLEEINPYQTGGATIHEVDYNSSSLLDAPFKFEAGTQNIAGIIAFKEALLYLKKISYENIEIIEHDLFSYLDKELRKLDGIEFYNTIENSIGSRSFNFKNIIHDDIGILVDKMGIALRVGHHCAQPIMKELSIKGTIRVSIAFYNDYTDIDNLIKALKRALNMLKD